MKIPIHVRYYSGAYIARAGSKSASCTACEESAARAVARKLGHKHFTLERLPAQGLHTYAFIMSPQEQPGTP